MQSKSPESVNDALSVSLGEFKYTTFSRCVFVQSSVVDNLMGPELGRKNQRLFDTFDNKFIDRDIGCQLVDICTVLSASRS